MEADGIRRAVVAAADAIATSHYEYWPSLVVRLIQLLERACPKEDADEVERLLRRVYLDLGNRLEKGHW